MGSSPYAENEAVGAKARGVGGMRVCGWVRLGGSDYGPDWTMIWFGIDVVICEGR